MRGGPKLRAAHRSAAFQSRSCLLSLTTKNLPLPPKPLPSPSLSLLLRSTSSPSTLQGAATARQQQSAAAESASRLGPFGASPPAGVLLAPRLTSLAVATVLHSAGSAPLLGATSPAWAAQAGPGGWGGLLALEGGGSGSGDAGGSGGAAPAAAASPPPPWRAQSLPPLAHSGSGGGVVAAQAPWQLQWDPPLQSGHFSSPPHAPSPAGPLPRHGSSGAAASAASGWPPLQRAPPAAARRRLTAPAAGAGAAGCAGAPAVAPPASDYFSGSSTNSHDSWQQQLADRALLEQPVRGRGGGGL
jgi:hypothetical protein